MGRIGWTELLLIAVVVILLFGANKLPDIGRALGRAVKEFRKATKEFQDEIKNDDDSKSGK